MVNPQNRKGVTIRYAPLLFVAFAIAFRAFPPFVAAAVALAATLATGTFAMGTHDLTVAGTALAGGSAHAAAALTGALLVVLVNPVAASAAVVAGEFLGAPAHGAQNIFLSQAQVALAPAVFAESTFVRKASITVATGTFFLGRCLYCTEQQGHKQHHLFHSRIL